MSLNKLNRCVDTRSTTRDDVDTRSTTRDESTLTITSPIQIVLDEYVSGTQHLTANSVIFTEKKLTYNLTNKSCFQKILILYFDVTL